jgi:hypothetical protein
MEHRKLSNLLRNNFDLPEKAIIIRHRNETNKNGGQLSNSSASVLKLSSTLDKNNHLFHHFFVNLNNSRTLNSNKCS